MNKALPAYLTIGFSINFLANTYITEIDTVLKDKLLEIVCQMLHAMFLGFLYEIVKAASLIKTISIMFLCFSMLIGMFVA